MSFIFSRALLTAQAIGMLIACVTINRKVNNKPNSIQEETSETQSSFIKWLKINFDFLKAKNVTSLLDTYNVRMNIIENGVWFMWQPVVP